VVGGVSRAQSDIQPVRVESRGDRWVNADTDSGFQEGRRVEKLTFCERLRRFCHVRKPSPAWLDTDATSLTGTMYVGSPYSFYRMRLRCEDTQGILLEESELRPISMEECCTPAPMEPEPDLPMPRRLEEPRPMLLQPGSVTRYPPLREPNR
jgi:hypothetical protein